MTWRVEQGDCLELLRGLPNASVDAVVTDPPYCSGGFREADKRSSKGLISDEGLQRHGWFASDNMGTAGLVWLLRSVAVQAHRLLVDGGSLLVFCDWRMLNNLAPALESAGLKRQGLVIWDKGAVGLGAGFRSQHECVLHFVKGVGRFHDASVGNVIRCPRPSNDREHPAEKPVDLMRALVRVVCRKGGTVLDPFCGSGSTGVATVMERSDFIGFERESCFVDIARSRVGASAAACVPSEVAVLGRASQSELGIFEVPV